MNLAFSRSMIAASAALALVALASNAQANDAKVYVIDVDKMAFGPAPAGLRVNDIVEWRNADILRHSATAADASFNIDLPPGGSGRTTLKKAGVIDYVCRFHPGMKGRLDVAP